MSILGTRVERREDPRLLTSGGVYVDDLREPALEGAAHVTFVRSPMAHARIEAIDVADAAAMPGVLGVFTGADLDVDPVAPGPGLGGQPLPSAMARPHLARDVVRYVGEPVAAVVTETRAQGVDAAELVSVDYEPLDAVVDVDDALRDEVLLFPEAGTNTAARSGERDESLFDGCEVVVTRRIENQRLAAAPLETRAAACAWGDDGRLTMWLSNQNAQACRDAVQAQLGLDEGQVRVITPDVGGGFGAKIGIDPDAVLLGWLSRRAGRPLRWSESRSENMVAMTHGRGQRQIVTIGGDREGRILAYRLDLVQDLGAYPLMSAFLPTFTGLMAGGPYDIAKVETTARCVVTNTMSTAAYRGAGRPEATAAIERAVDLFAAEVGLDPAEVRRRNAVRAEQFPYRTATGLVYDSGEYVRAIDAVLDAADYRALREEQARRRAEGAIRQLGLGISLYVEITAPNNTEGEHGRVEVLPDGSALVLTGSSAHGQGHATSFAMLVADQLGIDIDRVQVVHGDTDRVPAGAGTMGSRSLQLGGSAVQRAAVDVRDKGRALAAELIEIDERDVELVDGDWRVRGAASVGISWAELAERASDRGGLAADVHFVSDSPTFPFGVHLAVVEVDTETGAVEHVRHVTVDDAGPVLNPVLAEGQRHGGIAQGAAQALLEHMSYDADGNPQTANFADYAIITASELPRFELLRMETPTTLNPLGVKGIGEAGTIGATPAVHNAVVDALSHLGVSHIDMPTTPERVWAAINEA
ncbi:carbon-monoxide dehydrogenase large subunit [Saccharopolyspora erythraea NRRL 2338]|uniref:Carbon monoxide dehydrogenase large subunit n=2 Tax=Saccharopolyspora erythraea TaxID=1836 RepID=A4F8W5_SACEN|nr:xanthine dehydrogenase family protein molybdopterin-binding subunit [Saccharopolyspora erythraea]EQD86731.1 carbon monoxide dehydrogenase [Saccharopolyspora erythraea D]PFG94287.1 carbon-monoxide dehydrogenase large subunit [Saccharopolyspora erythraea NRRL 2338]QRK91057.1 xanthine dehydrogenase family protein molybdopterin-binding subunit [Saccharopolyspora erythraea]CAM00490.1 carbon monoxide dehydrogenase large subunit [Saccharopolyspora erythraea NRRL 2338]